MERNFPFHVSAGRASGELSRTAGFAAGGLAPSSRPSSPGIPGWIQGWGTEGLGRYLRRWGWREARKQGREQRQMTAGGLERQETRAWAATDPPPSAY